MRAMHVIQLKCIKRAEDFMQILGLNKTVYQLAMAAFVGMVMRSCEIMMIMSSEGH